MRSLILSATVGLLIPTLALAQGQGEAPYTIAVDVDLPLFNVTVRDRRGLLVSGLTRDDFQVSEDGVPQQITLFAAEDSPATVGIVIDSSGSMSRRRAEVAKAAIEFASAGNPGDELFVVNFNESVYLALPASIAFTNDTTLIRSAVLGAPPAGMTAMYDALALALDHLKAGTRDRKALVLLSDGGDNASLIGLNDVLRTATGSSATIYTIDIYDGSSDDRDPRALRRIAERSGGRAYFPDSIEDLGEIWHEISGEIRSQYTIGYRSSNLLRDGAFRRVRITATRSGESGLRVNTRDGYFAPYATGTNR